MAEITNPSGGIIIYHGTEHGYTRPRIPDPTVLTGRQGMDQYGLGFYVAADQTNPTVARDYSRTYARDNGVVLAGQLQSTDRLLNFGETIPQAQSAALQRSLASANTGIPALDEHYRALANRVGSMTGQQVWNELTSPTILSQTRALSGDALSRAAVHLDNMGTQIINRAGIDGLHIPRDQTIVFKGTGYSAIPSMHVDSVVGTGPVTATDDFRARQTANRPVIEASPRIEPPAQITVPEELRTTLTTAAINPQHETLRRGLSGAPQHQDGSSLRFDTTGMTDQQLGEVRRTLQAQGIRATLAENFDGDLQALQGRRVLSVRGADATTLAGIVPPPTPAVPSPAVPTPAVPAPAAPAAAAPTVPEAAPHIAEPHAPARVTTPTTPTRGPRGGGVIPALVIGTGVGAYSLMNGATPAQAALTAGETTLNGLVPDAANGFQGTLGRDVRLADRILNAADTTTGLVATGAALTGQLQVATPAAIANVAVNLARDVTYATGLGDQRGLVGEIAASVADRNRNVELFGRVDAALVAGRSTAETERLNDLRSNRELIKQQAQTLERFNPNALRRPGEPAAGAPPPLRTADGRVLTSYREIRQELSTQYSAAHHQYFTAVMDTAKNNPNAIAGVIAPPAAVPPAAPATAPEQRPEPRTGEPVVSQAPNVEERNRQVTAQFGANINAATYPNQSTAVLPPAQVAMVQTPAPAADADKPKPTPAPVMASPQARA